MCYRKSAPAHTMDVSPAQCNGAALLFIHGGGCFGGSSAVAVMPSGIRTWAMCVCATYRLVPMLYFQRRWVPGCVTVRAQASTWGFDAGIAAIGSSSGGHLAAMLGAMPDVGLPSHAGVPERRTDTTWLRLPDKLRGLICNFAPQEAAHDDLRVVASSVGQQHPRC